ncbi:MAG TPA: UbiA-like polyprenyltransferase [Abditibacterium sp.]|jgi:4-hydroxybenzoate polyprenyltransferase
MNSSAVPTGQNPLQTAKNYLELVKFSHTIFALPFALASMLVAAQGFPGWRVFAWILAAMIGARTAAMGFNRIVDRQIDAQNPRTANRELPAGKVSLRGAIALVMLASLLFFFACFQLNSLALVLAPVTLLTLFFYSFCKRFTSFSHFVLGLCLGIAPVGAWVAVTGQIALAPCVLCAAILLWVAGFDIIYATMDIEFDRQANLHSMVRKLGVPRALGFAKVLHAGFLALLFAFGTLAQLGPVFTLATCLIAAFLIYEHALVRPDDLRRVNAAFFTVNGAISVFFLVVVAGIVAWK